jgi:hypothetical protein
MKHRSDNTSPDPFGESPRVYRPSIAKALGNVIQAVVLEQMHYWLKGPGGKDHNGHHWIWKAQAELAEELGMTVGVARKALEKLRDQGLLISTSNPDHAWDRTLLWRIDQDAMAQLVAGIPLSMHSFHSPNACVPQNASSRSTERIESVPGTYRCGPQAEAIPESTSERPHKDHDNRITPMDYRARDQDQSMLISPRKLLARLREESTSRSESDRTLEVSL